MKMSAKKNNLQLGPGKRVTLDDLVNVAQAADGQLIIDDVLFNKFPESFTNSTPSSSTTDPTLDNLSLKDSEPIPEELIRAGVIARIVALSNGLSAVSKSTFKILVELINQRYTPKITSFDNAGEQLIEFLQGRRSLLNSNSTLPEILAKLIPDQNQYILCSEEEQAFLKHPFLSIGLASVIVQGANTTVRALDAIVALSIECAGAKLELFDATLYETYHAHRGQMQSATNLKLLLEGSKRVVNSVAPAANNNKNKNNNNAAANTTTNPALLAPFHNIPQVVGPSLELLTVTVK